MLGFKKQDDFLLLVMQNHDKQQREKEREIRVLFGALKLACDELRCLTPDNEKTSLNFYIEKSEKSFA